MMAALVLLAAVYVGSLLLRALLALSYARSLPASTGEPLPAGTLTLAQAILSGDPLLESRLRANLAALPGQTFLWLIDEDDSEAQRIAAKLRQANPAAEVQVETCSPCPDATNPKLWKLRRAATLTRTPLFCVVDDDTMLPATSAACLAAAATTHTVATGLPCYQDSGDAASGLLAQFVNNNSVFTYLGTSRLLRPFTLNGMGYALRRETLHELGNFEPILHELTDDLALATLVLQQGGAIHQGKAPLLVSTSVNNLAHYMQILHRWYVFTLLLLQRQRLSVQTLIFALHGLPPLLLLAMFILTAITATPASAALLVAVLAVRRVVITSMQRRYFGPGLHRPLLSILSELMQPVHLMHALAYRTIRWRTRRYRVRATHDFSTP